jgi:adenylate cyclase
MTMASQDDQTQAVRTQFIENQKIIDDLNAKLARKTDEVKIIQQISSELTSTLDLDRVLGIILDSMDSVLGFKHSMILLADPGGETLTVAASRGYPNAGIGAEVPIGQGVLGVVAKRRRIMRIGNLRSQRAYLASVRSRMEATGQGAGFTGMAILPGLDDAESQIGIPLLVRDRLVGVFSVESAKANAFNELDELLLSIVAYQVANAIDNARLHAVEVDRSKQLDAANSELSRLNATLEANVEARTSELSAALEQVEREKELSDNLLKRMAPPEVIPLMLENKLEARRLRVTVLFTDLEGFTGYTSGMEPDEVFAQLNHFFSWAGEIIQRYRGYINKTNGDGVMALFGVPSENATHHIDAVLAALAMQHELRKQFAFNMRVGINTGVITAGMLGPENKSLYDVLGDAVNVASRMESVCPPGGVTVSDNTRKYIKSYFEIEPLGEQEVKGKGAMRCFNVRGITPLARDRRRIDGASRFSTECLGVIEEVEARKRDRFAMIDFVSIQSRDAALGHNEAVASFALALYRELKGAPTASAGVDTVDERTLVDLALVHDIGKHALDDERLNAPSLNGDERDRLRKDLLDNSITILTQLDMAELAPALERFYRFERTRGADGEYDTLTEILTAADIFDALTAPKIYKGTPWRIVGALEELLRLPYCRNRDRPVFDAFIALMKPKDSSVTGKARDGVLFR